MAEYDFKAFTESVINSIGPNASPRIKQTLPILMRKFHEFCIEADITVEEWLFTCNLLVKAGQMSSPARNEVVLMSDVLGIESLVDTLAHVRTSTAADISTHSAILGPFYREGVKPQANDTSIVRQPEKDNYTYLTGQVFDSEGKPLSGALIDVWHDAADGLYWSLRTRYFEAQLIIGRFESDKDGRYSLVCLKPTPYPIPYDGPTGDMLQAMDRHPFRPAHIHFMVQAPKHRTLVTQVFDRKSKYLQDDSVFAVKDSLVVDFLPLGETALPEDLPDGEKVQFTLNYDIHLGAASGDSLDIEAPIGGEANGLLNGKH